MTTSEFAQQRLRNLHYDLIGYRQALIMLNQEPLEESVSEWVVRTIDILTQAIVVSGLAGLEYKRFGWWRQ